MINLKNLYLNNNRIKDIQPLKELTSLKELYLIRNQIRDIQSLKKLTSLKGLYLNENQITNIYFLKGLTNLTTLNLGNNQIENIDSIKNLKSLKILGLRHNMIIDIEPLKSLINITFLDLNVNEVSNIEPLSNLTKISKLYLGGNEIEDIQALKPLINLEVLNLEGNPITEKISFNLDDFRQQAKQIKSLLTLDSVKEKISLPIKILLLGNSKIGKTCLRLFLNDKDYCTDHNSTHILEVVKLKEQNATIWDFGGQDYYHSVHHLFFTLASLYIVMYDEETNENKYLEKEKHYNFKVNYWLENLNYITPNETIEKENGIVLKNEKKIMLVENKIDKNEKLISISDDYAIKNKYRINLCVNGKTPKNNSIQLKRLDLLKDEIINELKFRT